MNVLTPDKRVVANTPEVAEYFNKGALMYQLYVDMLAKNSFDIKRHAYCLQYIRPAVWRSHLSLSNDIVTWVCDPDKYYLNIGNGGGFLEKIFIDQGRPDKIIGADWNYTDLFFQPIRKYLKVTEQTAWQTNNVVTGHRLKLMNKYSGNGLSKKFEAILLVRFNAFWGNTLQKQDNYNQKNNIIRFLSSIKKYSDKLIWVTPGEKMTGLADNTRKYLDSIMLDEKYQNVSTTIVLDLTKV